MKMTKPQAQEVLNDRQIARDAAMGFAAYLGDSISGPLVGMTPEQFNAFTYAWDSQNVTEVLASYIQNALVRAKE